MVYFSRTYEDLHPDLWVSFGAVYKNGRMNYQSISEVIVPEELRNDFVISRYLAQESHLMAKLATLKYDGKPWRLVRLQLDNLRHDLIETANNMLKEQK